MPSRSAMRARLPRQGARQPACGSWKMPFSRADSLSPRPPGRPEGRPSLNRGTDQSRPAPEPGTTTRMWGFSAKTAAVSAFLGELADPLAHPRERLLEIDQPVVRGLGELGLEPPLTELEQELLS